MKKALVTGIAGFAGSHLAEFLLTKKIAVFGFYHPEHSTENIDHIKDKLELVACDILNRRRVKDALKNIDPTYVFHLAAFSSPAQSFAIPRETLENNIIGELNLLEALAQNKSRAKVLVIGSADEYGKISEKDLPTDEATPISPLSPYAVSKVAQDFLGFLFFLHHKLHVVRVRPFNHIGPRQSPSFVIAAFASRIAQLEKAGGGTMNVGNLESWRDFTDVRDMVRAYYLALERGQPGEVYNLGSGKVVKIEDVLAMIITFAKVKIQVRQDKKLFHPQDIKIIYCDFSKFKKQTGWYPKIPIRTTLFDTIEYERQKLQLTTDN